MIFSSSPKPRRAFTLTELLVVAAILAVLIAILIPTVSSAREKSKTTVCGNNLRQIAQATWAFAAENEGRGPGSASHTSPTSSSHSWADILDAEYFGRPGSQYAIVRMSSPATQKTLSCPNFVGGSSRRAYGMSGKVAFADKAANPYTRISGYNSNGTAFTYQGAGSTYYLGAKLELLNPTKILVGEKHSGNDNISGDDTTIVWNRAPDAATPDTTSPPYISWKAGPPVRVGDYAFRHPFFGKTQVIKLDSSTELLSTDQATDSKRY